METLIIELGTRAKTFFHTKSRSTRTKARWEMSDLFHLHLKPKSEGPVRIDIQGRIGLARYGPDRYAVHGIETFR
jgi:hypothetical protein